MCALSESEFIIYDETKTPKSLYAIIIVGFLCIVALVFCLINICTTNYTYNTYTGVVIDITQEQYKYYKNNIVHVKYGNGKYAEEDMKDITGNSGVEIVKGDKLIVNEKINEDNNSIVSVNMNLPN